MNNAQRTQNYFDDVANQAFQDGVARMGKVSVSKTEAYSKEADLRGCTFIIDADGIGMFLDDNQCEWDYDDNEILFY